ncbi:hypothetical protein GCK32_008195 [Trichostrongylus colubriformis]|uniref:Uncharacterized protein n=1 Tax=Trichostrongylus colubriformis TaxID=6319 RepID=A0AAN8IRC6_TRICO
MSSTNDALSYLVGLANAKAAASASTFERCDPQHQDHQQNAQDSFANVVYFDERYDDGIPVSQEELS